MTPDAAGIEAALAAGLAAHRLNYGTQLVTEEEGLWYAYCSCPGEWTFTGPSVDLAAAHDAHVAAALLPVVTQAQAAERERVAQAIKAEPLTRENSWHDGFAAGITRAARIARADESGA